MSVIAKFNLTAIRSFGAESLYEMGLVCENDLMAMYATADEDRLFTKASPWGEARLGVQASAEFPQAMAGDKFYAVLICKEELGHDGKHVSGAWLRCPARIASVTDFGGTSRQVEICSAFDVPQELALRRFSWRMSVDNPPAIDQLRPGDGWVLYLFKAGDFTVRSALDAVHEQNLVSPGS